MARLRKDSQVIASNDVIANTTWSRVKGLLGKSDFPMTDALWIKPCNSIHTFFMRLAIDVVYLDKHDRVLRTRGAMRPWRIGPVVWAAGRVIELPLGALARSGTQVGDELILTELPST